jgi:hypothetical protein
VNYIPHCYVRENVRGKKKTCDDCVGKERREKDENFG